jgi:hypothetical protein
MRKDKKYHFIYKTTNLLSGKYYYGLHSTDNLEDGYLGSGRRLRYSLNKHGKDNHKREIIEFCNSRKELLIREKDIVTINEIAKEDCINLNVGGTSSLGHDNDTREKMSLSKKGIKLTDEHRYNISESLKGRRVTDKTRNKIRESLLGSTLSDERREKISKTKKLQLSDKTNHPFFGKTHSDESKMKMSKAQIGIPKRKLTCPHCGKVGGEPQLKQFHFDRCKLVN